MSEMSRREQIMAASRGERADRLPAMLPLSGASVQKIERSLSG